MDRIEKAGPEKAQRLVAADARRRQEELEAARRVAAARAESEEAERLELERQAAALRDWHVARLHGALARCHAGRYAHGQLVGGWVRFDLPLL